jgi:thioredoxin 1
MVEPIVEELAVAYEGSLKVCKLHVDRNPKTRDKYRILGVPTFALFQKGEIVEQKTGAQSKRQLEQMLVQALSKKTDGYKSP